LRDGILLALVTVFVPFSLMSIGGGAAIIAGIQHESVVVQGWLTSQQFINLFAISRAAPGPGTMLATLVGWSVAGWWGAIVASLAMFVPSSLLCYAVIKLSNRHREKTWHKAVREGLAPVGVGLVIAGVIAILRLSGAGVLGGAIAATATGILLWMPRFPILAVLFMGGLATWILHGLGMSMPG
jgi:chromate transporter